MARFVGRFLIAVLVSTAIVCCTFASENRRNEDGHLRWVHVVQPDEPIVITGYTWDRADSLSTLEFEVLNRSGLPVYEFTYQVSFETLDPATVLAFTLQYGDPELSGPSSPPPGTPCLAPGVTMKLDIPKRFAAPIEERLAQTERVHAGLVRLISVNQGSGNQWIIQTESYERIPEISFENRVRFDDSPDDHSPMW